MRLIPILFSNMLLFFFFFSCCYVSSLCPRSSSMVLVDFVYVVPQQGGPASPCYSCDCCYYYYVSSEIWSSGARQFAYPMPNSLNTFLSKIHLTMYTTLVRVALQLRSLCVHLPCQPTSHHNPQTASVLFSFTPSLFSFAHKFNTLKVKDSANECRSVG